MENLWEQVALGVIGTFDAQMLVGKLIAEAALADDEDLPLLIQKLDMVYTAQ